MIDIIKSANFNPGLMKKLKIKSPKSKRKSRSASKDEGGQKLRSRIIKKSPKKKSKGRDNKSIEEE